MVVITRAQLCKQQKTETCMILLKQEMLMCEKYLNIIRKIRYDIAASFILQLKNKTNIITSELGFFCADLC